MRRIDNYEFREWIQSAPGADLQQYPGFLDYVARNRSVSSVSNGDAFGVQTYRELVSLVAVLGFLHRRFCLLYRGQRVDWKSTQGGPAIFPTIFRPQRTVTGEYKRHAHPATILKRWRLMMGLIDGFRGRQQHDYYSSIPYDEYFMALFQHYQVCETPLIDVTQSLRAAASFALRESPIGYVYVFGLPHPDGSISHSLSEDMVIVKLQNVCPPNALRPHYQEGYLVGKLPFYPRRQVGDNLARRMVAKFEIDNSNGRFWDDAFAEIPIEALVPPDDPFEDQLKEQVQRIQDESLGAGLHS